MNFLETNHKKNTTERNSNQQRFTKFRKVNFQRKKNLRYGSAGHNNLKKTLQFNSRKANYFPPPRTPNFNQSPERKQNPPQNSPNTQEILVCKKNIFEEKRNSISSRISLKSAERNTFQIPVEFKAIFTPEENLKNFNLYFVQSEMTKVKKILFNFNEIEIVSFEKNIRNLKNSLHVFIFYLKLIKMISSQNSIQLLERFINEIKNRKFKSLFSNDEKNLKIFIFRLENILKSRMISEKDALKYTLKFLSDEESFNSNAIKMIFELAQQRLGKIMGLGFVFKGMIEEVIQKAKLYIEIFEKGILGEKNIFQALNLYFKFMAESVGLSMNVVYLLQNGKFEFVEYDDIEGEKEDYIVIITDLTSPSLQFKVLLSEENLKKKLKISKSEKTQKFNNLNTPSSQEIKIEHLKSQSPNSTERSYRRDKSSEKIVKTPLTQKVKNNYFVQKASKITPFKPLNLRERERATRKKRRLSGYSFNSNGRNTSNDSNKRKCEYYQKLKKSDRGRNSSKSRKYGKRKKLKGFNILKDFRRKIDVNELERDLILEPEEDQEIRISFSSRGNSKSRNPDFLRLDTSRARKKYEKLFNSNKGKKRSSKDNKENSYNKADFTVGEALTKNPRIEKNKRAHPLSLRNEQDFGNIDMDVMKKETYFGSNNQYESSNRTVNKPCFAPNLTPSWNSQPKVFVTPQQHRGDDKELKKFTKSELRRKITEVNEKIRENFNGIQVDKTLKEIQFRGAGSMERGSRRSHRKQFNGIKLAMNGINDLLYEMAKGSAQLKQTKFKI